MSTSYTGNMFLFTLLLSPVSLRWRRQIIMGPENKHITVSFSSLVQGITVTGCFNINETTCVAVIILHTPLLT
jgi:hypothetical protein